MQRRTAIATALLVVTAALAVTAVIDLGHPRAQQVSWANHIAVDRVYERWSKKTPLRIYVGFDRSLDGCEQDARPVILGEFVAVGLEPPLLEIGSLEENVLNGMDMYLLFGDGASQQFSRLLNGLRSGGAGSDGSRLQSGESRDSPHSLPGSGSYVYVHTKQYRQRASYVEAEMLKWVIREAGSVQNLCSSSLAEFILELLGVDQISLPLTRAFGEKRQFLRALYSFADDQEVTGEGLLNLLR